LNLCKGSSNNKPTLNLCKGSSNNKPTLNLCKGSSNNKPTLNLSKGSSKVLFGSTLYQMFDEPLQRFYLAQH
jgi:hypothetical protein